MIDLCNGVFLCPYQQDCNFSSNDIRVKIPIAIVLHCWRKFSFIVLFFHQPRIPPFIHLTLPWARCWIWWRLARSSQSNGTCSNRFQFKAQGRGCPGDMVSGSGRWPMPGVSLTNLKYSGVGNLSAGWEIRRWLEIWDPSVGIREETGGWGNTDVPWILFSPIEDSLYSSYGHSLHWILL